MTSITNAMDLVALFATDATTRPLNTMFSEHYLYHSLSLVFSLEIYQQNFLLLLWTGFCHWESSWFRLASSKSTHSLHHVKVRLVANLALDMSRGTTWFGVTREPRLSSHNSC